MKKLIFSLFLFLSIAFIYSASCYLSSRTQLTLSRPMIIETFKKFRIFFEDQEKRQTFLNIINMPIVFTNQSQGETIKNARNVYFLQWDIGNLIRDEVYSFLLSTGFFQCIMDGDIIFCGSELIN